jgi:fused signal recognition particle receptor
MTEEKKGGFFSLLRRGLSKTHDKFVQTVKGVFRLGRKLDKEAMDELAEALIAADFGPRAADRMVQGVQEAYKAGDFDDAAGLFEFLKADLKRSLSAWDSAVHMAPSPPTVIMVAGVNGVGKTTSIAKLARYFKDQGRKTLLCAADTYRAAAVEQLAIWAERVGVDLVKHQQGGDPAAVAFDACEAAKARHADVLIVDTAGRLQTKEHLMRELSKIHKVIGKQVSGAPHEVLLVLDATTGQNAISQAKLFREAIQVTGLFLAKLDGTAKGGIVVGMRDQIDLPVKFVGVGEKADDIAEFSAERFVDALFE